MFRLERVRFVTRLLQATVRIDQTRNYETKVSILFNRDAVYTTRTYRNRKKTTVRRRRHVWTINAGRDVICYAENTRPANILRSRTRSVRMYRMGLFQQTTTFANERRTTFFLFPTLASSSYFNQIRFSPSDGPRWILGRFKTNKTFRSEYLR